MTSVHADSPPSFTFSAGLIVRSVDQFIRDDSEQQTGLCICVMHRDARYEEIAASIVRSRRWGIIHLERRHTPTQFLRRLARLVGVEATGIRPSIVLRLLQHFQAKRRRQTVIVTGERFVLPSIRAIYEATQGRALVVVLLVNQYTFDSWPIRSHPQWGFVQNFVTEEDRRVASVALVRRKESARKVGRSTP